jgi:hypothetical protein
LLSLKYVLVVRLLTIVVVHWSVVGVLVGFYTCSWLFAGLLSGFVD